MNFQKSSPMELYNLFIGMLRPVFDIGLVNLSTTLAELFSH